MVLVEALAGVASGEEAVLVVEPTADNSAAGVEAVGEEATGVETRGVAGKDKLDLSGESMLSVMGSGAHICIREAAAACFNFSCLRFSCIANIPIFFIMCKPQPQSTGCPVSSLVASSDDIFWAPN
jgi:hypothetical protein